MLMIRSLLLTSLLAIPMVTNANGQSDLAWRFEVFLDERSIGYHDFLVSQEGETQRVEIEASFDVKVLFVNLFRYRHQNTETWQNNCLTGIAATTDANGKDFEVSGRIEPNGFSVMRNSNAATLPDCVMTFAYWNPAFLQSEQLLNSQTGEYEPVTITRVAEERLNLNGKSLPTVRYQVNAAAGPITLWYHEDDYRWLALESEAAGGRTLRYEALSLPAGLPQIAER